MLNTTIVVPTRNRSASLKCLLDKVMSQEDPPDWDLIVVDNGSSDDTLDVMRALPKSLSVMVIEEPVSGKSRALNRALEHVRGDLVLFTDDDVLPSPRWLRSLHSAALRAPAAGVYCGPIVPYFPEELPAWLVNHRWASAAFANFNPPVPEGPLPRRCLPFGPNMAVRKEFLAAMQFREDLGPSAAEPLMSEDTDFARRLREQHHEIWFCPEMSVVHVIRNELTNMAHLLDRAFHLGRSEVIRTYGESGVAIAQLQRSDASSIDEARFETACLVSYIAGQWFQQNARGCHAACRTLRESLLNIFWDGDVAALGPAAAAWLQNGSGFMPAHSHAHCAVQGAA